MGLVSILAWIIPIVGFPVTICAIVFSSLGLNSENRRKAVAGLVLGIIFVVLTLVNSIAGAVLGATKALNEETKPLSALSVS